MTTDTVMGAEELLNQILGDSRSGSTELALKVLDFYSSAKKDGYALEKAYESINAAHSGMGLVRNVNSILQSANSSGKQDLGKVVRNLRKEITEQSGKAVENFSGILSEDETIVTISNSSAVREALLKYRDNVSTLYILEGRPGLEGQTLAEHLTENGLDVTVVTDASVQKVSKECTKAISGSDAVLSDYSLIHKNGTFPLFMGTRYYGKDNYSLSIDLKFETQFDASNYPTFRGHKSSEITDRKIKASNTYYDITPASFITAYVTNGGIISPGV